MASRKKQFVVAGISVLAVLLLLGLVKGLQFGAMAEAGENWAPPPQAVTTADVQAQNWQARLGAVGTVVAVQGVTIAPEVSGSVQEIAFESGQVVEKGAVLLRLDTSVERAALASARSGARLADIDLARTKKLREAGAASDSQLDTNDARASQARAELQNVRAAIAKKVIRAPFGGRVGIRQVNLGEVLAPGTPVVELQSFDPVYVDFHLPQQSLSAVRQNDKVDVTADTFEGRGWSGKVDTVDVQVDASTRNVRVRAIVDNPDGKLVPGMFVDVQTMFAQTRDVLLVPESAVLYAPYGDSVFIVKPAEGQPKGNADPADTAPPTVEKTLVRLGERRGDLVEVVEGLSAGQSVVSTGAFKLRNGMAVLIRNDLAPAVSDKPTPANQ